MPMMAELPRTLPNIPAVILGEQERAGRERKRLTREQRRKGETEVKASEANLRSLGQRIAVEGIPRSEQIKMLASFEGSIAQLEQIKQRFKNVAQGTKRDRSEAHQLRNKQAAWEMSGLLDEVKWNLELTGRLLAAYRDCAEALRKAPITPEESGNLSPSTALTEDLRAPSCPAEKSTGPTILEQEGMQTPQDFRRHFEESSAIGAAAAIVSGFVLAKVGGLGFGLAAGMLLGSAAAFFYPNHRRNLHP